MKEIILLLVLLLSPVLCTAVGLGVKTKVLWVGQYSGTDSFYFSVEDRDPTCHQTGASGIYMVHGSNAKGIYSMLLAAASSGKYISFSISSCHTNDIAIVDEMYYHAN